MNEISSIFKKKKKFIGSFLSLCLMFEESITLQMLFVFVCVL